MLAKITKRNVDGLHIGQSIADTEVRGFRVRRLPSGLTVYEFRYSRGGQRPCINLGIHGSITPDQARELAKARAGEVAAGRDLAKERQAAQSAGQSSVNGVLDAWLARHVHKHRPRTAHKVEQSLERDVRPTLGKRSIYELTRRDVIRLLDTLEERSGAPTAHVVLGHLRAALNWYQVRDEQFRSPIIRGMSRIKPSERARRRILDDQELRDLWAALDDLPGVPACFAPFVRTLLLTAQRRTEVSHMRWEEIHGNTWRIPSERYKTGVETEVPLTDAVLVQLGERRTTGFVLSTSDGITAFSSYSRSQRLLLAKTTELRKYDGRQPMPHWQLHDLRRTARSLLSRAGVRPDIAERVLGHGPRGVAGVYDRHRYEAEKRDALEKLAALVDRMLHPTEAVVTFPKKTRRRKM